MGAIINQAKLFISYRRSDSAESADRIREWLEQSLPVSQIFYDIDSVPPAAPWRPYIADLVPTLQGMLVVIGPTWLSDRLVRPDDTVRLEIELATANQVPLIPILVQGASMPNSAQLPESIKALAGYNAISLRLGHDNRVRDWERLRQGIQTQTGIVLRARDLSETDQLRNTLLRLATEQVQNGMQAALKDLTNIDLGLAERPGVIDPPYYRPHLAGPSDFYPLASKTQIADVFDNHGDPGSLLILGEQGAGKTMLLLELEERLVEQAKLDQSRAAPVPVLMNLASWSNTTATFKDWLSDALQESFRLPATKVGIITQSFPLVLLLDGLDEVKDDETREVCITQINEYLKEKSQATHLVVCCRADDYFAAKTRLRVENAVQVQPLIPQQIENYLTTNTLENLKHVLRTHETLAELAVTPLWLNLMAITYRDTPAESLPTEQSAEEAQHAIFKRYLAYKLTPDYRRVGNGLIRDEDYAALLAKHSRRGSHEKNKQADMNQLEVTSDKPFRYSQQQALIWLRWIARQLREHPEGAYYLERMRPGMLETPRRLRWTMALTYGLVGGLVSGLIGGLVGELDGGLIGGLFGCLAAGLFVGLSTMLHYGLVGNDITLVDQAQFSGRNLIVGLVFGLTVGLVFGLFGALDSGISGGLVDGFTAGLVVWVMYFIYSSFGSSALENSGYQVPGAGIIRTGKNGLVIGLVGGLGAGLVVGLVVGVVAGLDIGFGTGLIVGVDVGLFGALDGGLGIGLFVGLVVGLFGVLDGDIVVGPAVGLRVGLFAGLFAGLLAGLLAGLVSGRSSALDTYIRYWIVRSLLARAGFLPNISLRFWLLQVGRIDENDVSFITKRDPYIAFLTDMVDRNIVFRSGNGFAFIHSLLRDYLVSMEDTNVYRPSSSASQ
ncbi:MAG: NACHT domain-containing protein [Ktedonobacterales bacterium]